MHANVSTLQQSTVDSELAELERYGAMIRVQLERENQHTPEIFESIVRQHRRRVSDMAIALRCSLLKALLFMRNEERPPGMLPAEWRMRKDYDLIATLEMYLQAGIPLSRD